MTDAEVADAYKVCDQAMKDYSCDIASVPTDNAASFVAKQVCHKLPCKALLSRDPSHSTDLLSKDLASTKVVQDVMTYAEMVTDICKNDRIDSMKNEMIASAEVEFSKKAVSMCKTRMNLCHDYIEHANAQHNFILLLPRNEKFRKFYEERSKKKKDELKLVLHQLKDESVWAKFEMMTSRMTIHFKKVQKACSRNDLPLSVFVLLVQALKNDLIRGMDDEFDEVLGQGAADEVMDMIEDRFNMDGMDPSGRKVGLLDETHLMCFIVDPYSRFWRSTFKLGTHMGLLVKKMIEIYVPKDKDGTSKTRERVKKEFMVSTNCM